MCEEIDEGVLVLRLWIGVSGGDVCVKWVIVVGVVEGWG